MTSQWLTIKADETLSRNTKPSSIRLPVLPIVVEISPLLSRPCTQDGATPKSQDTAVNRQPGHLKAVTPGRLTRGRHLTEGHAAPPPGSARSLSSRLGFSPLQGLAPPGAEEGEGVTRPTPDPTQSPAAPAKTRLRSGPRAG